ncbi:MAG: ribosome small subunit-dependent GTPase A [Lachnospiraceae bacterium]
MSYLARVKEQHHTIYKVILKEGNLELTARISGKLQFRLEHQWEYPVVGDWVQLDRNTETKGDAIITEVEQRKTAMQRVEAGISGRTQIIAANIDLLFICMSLNENYNLSRLERYLAAAYGCKITPVVVLTKADLCEDVPVYLERIHENNPEVEIITCTREDEHSYDKIAEKITSNITAGFIGSSGVGKSTIINFLVGEEKMKTQEIREEDSRGRHTTTHRELIQLANGGTVIDTPGMREFKLDESDVEDVFQEIQALAAGCRFSDCSHTKEPGCRVMEALKEGKIDKKRYQNYLKLKQEEQYRKSIAFKSKLW